MKILITTMHRGNNIGSALQTYALSEAIKKSGNTPYILDYIPERINFSKNVKHCFNTLFRKNSLKAKYNALRSLAILLSDQIIYGKFFRRNINLTHSVHSIEEITRSNLQYDIYMTGSDQVWNSIHNQGIEYVFYLDFVPDGYPRIAYAASFGKEHLDEWESPETKRLLERYQAISVREASGVTILKSLGLDGTCVLDPTFLLTKDEWMQHIPEIDNKEKYLLIYSVEPNKEELIKYAGKIAKSLDLKVYIIDWGFKKYPGTDKLLSFLNPLQVIAYFAHAEYIIASSFHGTAFSVNFNKQFISISPKRFSTRVKSLLGLIGLSGRLMNSETFDQVKAMEPIDYTHVNERLSIERQKSYSFLTKAINGEYENDML